MAITQEITRISTAKADIKSAIEAKGVTVPSNALIDTYDDYVAAIASGGGGSQDLVDLIEGDITTLNIPSGTTKINSYALSYCSSLASVTIPNSVTIIRESAFMECQHLTSIIIPSGVTYIGSQAFQKCIRLASPITIPSGVTELPSNTFNRCTSLPSVTLPNGFLKIGSYCFEECTSLTSITIPSSVNSLGDYTFKGCTSLTSVTFDTPCSFTSIGSYTFYGCGLTNIVIPEGVTKIWSSFGSCTSLQTIELPSTLNELGSYAFEADTSLTSVTCKATTPPTLNYSVFQGCTNLAHIYVPASSVETYKAANRWSNYASIIEAIPTA